MFLFYILLSLLPSELQRGDHARLRPHHGSVDPTKTQPQPPTSPNHIESCRLTQVSTGCSAGGIGFELALAFQKRQLHVFATARSLSKMQHLAKLPNITLLQLDVTSPESVAAAVKNVQATGDGKLKYLINNAGLGFTSPVLDVDIEKAKEMWEVNYWGVLRTTKAFAGLVVEGKGTIVNVGSAAGYVSFPYSCKYSPDSPQYVRNNMYIIMYTMLIWHSYLRLFQSSSKQHL